MLSKNSKIVILGSGPIVIGQACEFDYSGTQAIKALKEKGYKVILINSNPATIMTDPGLADSVYVEPLRMPFVKKILEKERPQALIPTLGGQVALNLGIKLAETGVLKDLNIQLLGASLEVIQKAEDRQIFRNLLSSLGAHFAESYLAKSFKEGIEIAKKMGFPIVLRPNYTLGGGGGGVAYSLSEYEKKLIFALQESPTSEVLIEKSLLGFEEFELELMRDKNGNFVIVCSIENIDPCGVHTGDSMAVAPQQSLCDREYQAMREEAKKIIGAIGLQTGGANIQFAVDPKTRKRFVIEVNPRVSRSSALASKATGFPIAKIAALLAVGYTLEELQNDITKSTSSCYEPALDYVTVKIPRFDFEKFEGSKDILTTQMKSVGEVMALGRTFKEALGKAMASLEKPSDLLKTETKISNKELSYPSSKRIFRIFDAFRQGFELSKLVELTQIHPWFLEQVKQMVDAEQEIKSKKSLCRQSLLKAKRFGLSDFVIAHALNKSESDIYKLRKKHKVCSQFFKVDTCAGEFESQTPYYYSSYFGKGEEAPEVSQENLIAILGSGPNRIGQGIEFDYSCVRGIQKLRDLNYRVAMINSNPETVSTDYDVSDFFIF